MDDLFHEKTALQYLIWFRFDKCFSATVWFAMTEVVKCTDVVSFLDKFFGDVDIPVRVGRESMEHDDHAFRPHILFLSISVRGHILDFFRAQAELDDP